MEIANSNLLAKPDINYYFLFAGKPTASGHLFSNQKTGQHSRGICAAINIGGTKTAPINTIEPSQAPFIQIFCILSPNG
jgi:hypothetical protein